MLPPIARRFIAGEDVATALQHVRTCNADDIGVILNRLGEHYDDPSDVRADMTAYLDLIDDLADSDLDACLSVKPSQVGLTVSADLFESSLRRIITYGAERDVFVWCDMEDASTTDTTIDVVESLAREFPWQAGLCLQSNLKRTRDDLEHLIDVPIHVRITKGAYDEPADIAYTDQRRVNEAFHNDIAYLFEHRSRGVAVGSHDPAMISEAIRLGTEYGTDYEIQLLMGVRTDAQRDLARQGVRVVQYAPFGTRWAAYFYRRLRERRRNLLFAVRAVLGR